jgi:hypothetical protein
MHQSVGAVTDTPPNRRAILPALQLEARPGVVAAVPAPGRATPSRRASSFVLSQTLGSRCRRGRNCHYVKSSGG